MNHLSGRVFLTRFVAALLALPIVGQDPAAEEEGKPWREILAAKPGAWAAPDAEVVWRTDLHAALREAAATDRPLFVTLRCLPCKQCASFDQDVLEGGPELTPLLRRFVTVRLTDAMQIDLARLPVEGFQDFDMSWWGWFLSPESQVYGVFGGRDEVSDTTRISSAALAATMRRVLDHHHTPGRREWNVDGPAVADDVAPTSPSQLPGYESWRRQSLEAPKQSCLHCHQVAEILRQPAIDADEFDMAALAPWPLPENVGLKVDRDDGLLVTEVREGSPAARIGVAVGDRLVVADGRRLFGQADLRAALHRHEEPDPRIGLGWRRGDEFLTGSLAPTGEWRKTVLDWRMSVSQGNLGVGPGFFPLRARGGGGDGMAIRPFFGRDVHRSASHAAGLRQHHTIVAVDGERRRMNGRTFLTWFRLRYGPGDTVVFTVREGNAERDVRVVLRKP